MNRATSPLQHVTKGMEIVKKIEVVKKNAMDKPVEDVTIESVELIEK